MPSLHAIDACSNTEWAPLFELDRHTGLRIPLESHLLTPLASGMKDQFRYDCRPDGVIANGGRGYHLREWIIVE